MAYSAMQVAALSDFEDEQSGLASSLLFAVFQIGDRPCFCSSGFRCGREFWMGPSRCRHDFRICTYGCNRVVRRGWSKTCVVTGKLAYEFGCIEQP